MFSSIAKAEEAIGRLTYPFCYVVVANDDGTYDVVAIKQFKSF